MKEQVVLVDENDEPVGLMPKLEAHEKGALHRAISVFIFNKSGELLLQQRQHDKYHSGGLWTNTCCSHPYSGEKTSEAAQRRLWQEMGIHSELNFLFSFQYSVEFDNGLKENELDHIFWGISNEIPAVDKREVAAYKYVSKAALLADMQANPDSYTEWFKICIDKVFKNIGAGIAK